MEDVALHTCFNTQKFLFLINKVISIKPHIDYDAAIWGLKVTTNQIQRIIAIKKVFKKYVRRPITTLKKLTSFKYFHYIYYKKTPTSNIALYSTYTNNRHLKATLEQKSCFFMKAIGLLKTKFEIFSL